MAGRNPPQLCRSRTCFFPSVPQIITLVYAILHAKQSAALIWLSSFAILFFVVFALSISVSLSIITLLIVAFTLAL